jgi:CO/xanthine dehydrogenase FAD-binding subunit
VATQSSDTVPVLLAADARILLLGATGERSLRLRDLYRYNGMDHLQIEKGELLTQIRIPVPEAGFRGSYQKLRTRASIDFPQLGVAIGGQFEGETPVRLEIVIGAVNPQPKPVRGIEEFLGRPLGDDSIEGICDKVFQQTRPQGSVHGDVAWRRQMARVFVKRGLQQLRNP